MASYQADLAETQYIDGPNSRFAYRRFVPTSSVPLVMAIRFRGTIDHWDPALLDVLNSERDVIVFDNRGTGRTSGVPPATLEGLAEGLLEFVDSLNLPEVDLLGWSMGGYIVQIAALRRPALVRRLIVAGSGPGRVPDMPARPDKVERIGGKPVLDDEDYLYLFFPTPIKHGRPVSHRYAGSIPGSTSPTPLSRRKRARLKSPRSDLTGRGSGIGSAN
jgi:pimeloyl-ACP methyl ester carboxylesterase